MYICTKAIVRKKNSKGRWVEEDLSEASVATLFDTYSEVYLILTHPTLDHEVSLNLADVAAQVAGLLETVSVADWLESLGDRSLPTRDEIPTVTTRQVKYNDAFVAGYTLRLVDPNGSINNDLPVADRYNILLTRPDTNYELFYKNCLVTVNGMVHRTDYDASGVYVIEGGKSARIANENHVGLISFRDIGELDFISITEDMIYNPHPNGQLRHQAHIALPKDIGTKMIALVLGGYLHLLDSYFIPTGERSIKIDMANLPLIQRFYASKGLIDLSPMTDLYEKDPTNPDHVALDDFFSDASIKAFLTLSQSFVVLIDTDNLYVEKHKLEYTGLPGRYYSHFRPDWPIRTELGRLPEYVAIPESDIWVIAVQDNFSTRYRFESTYWHQDVGIDSSRESHAPVFYAQGQLLEIGSDIQGFTPTT